MKNLLILVFSTIIALLITPFSAGATTNAQLAELLEKGETQAVIDTLEARQNKSFNDFEMLVNTYARVDLDDAEDAAYQMIKQLSDDYRAYLLHASIMGAQASDSVFSALGYAKKAKKSLAKAVELEPNNTETLNALMGFYLMAPGIAGGDDEEAKKLAARIAQVDEVEGKYAQIRIFTHEDDLASALALLAELSEQDGERIKAGFQLGNVYIGEEKYALAIDAFASVIAGGSPSLPETEDQETVDAFNQNQLLYMLSYYRIGWSALKANVEFSKGIEAMQQYLEKLPAIEQPSTAYPSAEWAKLRLTELLLLNEKKEQANQVFASINSDSQDKAFAELHKSLKKRL